jgi:hypothetical protein
MPASVNIIEPTALEFDTITKANISCFGLTDGKLVAIATGGAGDYVYTLKKDGVETGNISGTTSGEFTGLIAGKGYTIEITDKNACGPVISKEDSIKEPLVISIDTIYRSHISCFGLTDGKLTVSASGGTGDLVYTLKQNNAESGNTSGLSTGAFTALPAGKGYTIEVTDSNNCTPAISSGDSIGEPLAITIGEPTKTNLRCYGYTDASIAAIGAGGTGPLSYTLKLDGTATGNTSGDLTGAYTGLAAGVNYTVEVTDSNKCTPAVTQAIEIIQPEALKIAWDTAIRATTKVPTWNGKIIVVAGGGTSPYSYTLSTAQVNDSGIFVNLSPSKYKVVITDANGCGPISTDSLEIVDASSVPVVNQGKLSIFPNPATKYIMVRFEGIVKADFILELISSNGALVFKQVVEKEIIKQGDYRIDLEGIARGVYILKINGSLTREKVVIQ